jgi:hypothetical protein
MPYVIPLAILAAAFTIGIRSQIESAKRAAVKHAISRFLDLGL